MKYKLFSGFPTFLFAKPFAHCWLLKTSPMVLESILIFFFSGQLESNEDDGEREEKKREKSCCGHWKNAAARGLLLCLIVVGQQHKHTSDEETSAVFRSNRSFYTESREALNVPLQLINSIQNWIGGKQNYFNWSFFCILILLNFIFFQQTLYLKIKKWRSSATRS